MYKEMQHLQSIYNWRCLSKLVNLLQWNSLQEKKKYIYIDKLMQQYRTRMETVIIVSLLQHSPNHLSFNSGKYS